MISTPTRRWEATQRMAGSFGCKAARLTGRPSTLMTSETSVLALKMAIMTMPRTFHWRVIQMPGDDMVDKSGIVKDIGTIGSIEWQRRWCVNGTVQGGYAELDEHIETTIHEAKRQATHSTTRDKYSEHEREALIRFH